MQNLTPPKKKKRSASPRDIARNAEEEDKEEVIVAVHPISLCSYCTGNRFMLKYKVCNQ